MLTSEGVVIKNIVDDYEKIQGTYIENVEIISYKEFCNRYKEYERIAVVLTTIYGKPVIKKISIISNVQIYELYEWYSELIGKNYVVKNFPSEIESLQDVKKQIRILKDKWMDKESENVLDGLMYYLDMKDMSIIAEICTEDEQYFIPEVKKAINFSMNIIDAGAYRGELEQSLKNNNLNFEKWYCFEADEKNYAILLEQSRKDESNVRQICINKGLWSSSGKLFFEEGGTASRIVPYETNKTIEVVSIDDYIGEEKCNFIKMDIEGAEFPALLGAINLIRRERPILAISIYHSLEDLWKIPQYLMSELDNYRYCVRHHSLIFSETVLYGIPNEL